MASMGKAVSPEKELWEMGIVLPIADKDKTL
jgi:hypothetical protein